MTSRMNNPIMLVPEAGQAMQSLAQALFASAEMSNVPRKSLFLAYLRASQLNGDSVCVDLHTRNALSAGDVTDRLLTVSAWRDTQHFTAAERAALALSEAMTRICDQINPIPDEIYQEAALHYEEQALATLITGIAVTNLYNRLNVCTRQTVSKPAGI